jgi:hypothetical protein
MLVTAIPLTSFIHNSINAVEGKPIEMDESLASELERHGLVRIKLVHRRVDQALSLGSSAEIISGKAVADGQGPPSSALPLDPRSRPGTLHLPKRGGQQGRSGTR